MGAGLVGADCKVSAVEAHVLVARRPALVTKNFRYRIAIHPRRLIATSGIGAVLEAASRRAGAAPDARVWPQHGTPAAATSDGSGPRAATAACAGSTETGIVPDWIVKIRRLDAAACELQGQRQ